MILQHIIQLLPSDILLNTFLSFLTARDIGLLDSTILNKALRPHYLNSIKNNIDLKLNNITITRRILCWLIKREIKVTKLNLNANSEDAQATQIDVDLDEDEEAELFPYFRTDPITDELISQLASIKTNCNLLEITFNNCLDSVTDKAVITLAENCPHLTKFELKADIFFSGRYWVTDYALCILSSKCGGLLSCELSFCPGVTDIGITCYSWIILIHTGLCVSTLCL